MQGVRSGAGAGLEPTSEEIIMFKHVGSLALVGSLLSGFATQVHAEADIGFDRAAQLALARVPGRVHSIERERELYEVEIRDEHGVEFEVTLNARDGTVLDVERDD
jgi:uncharacterized membrane protein YkoI